MLYVLCLMLIDRYFVFAVKYLYDKLIRNLNRTSYYVSSYRNISYQHVETINYRRDQVLLADGYYVKRKQIQSVVGKKFMD